MSIINQGTIAAVLEHLRGSAEFKNMDIKAAARQARLNVNREVEEKRQRDVDIGYRNKQKVVRKARSEGKIDRDEKLNKSHKELNKLIIKSTDDIIEEVDSDEEAEARDDDFIPIRDTIDVVRDLLVDQKIRGKFRVKFTSYRNPRITTTLPKDFTFNNIDHYINFINTLDKVDAEPVNSTATLRVGVAVEDVFKYVKVQVFALEGGCNKNPTVKRKLKSGLFTYEVYNPVGQNNNCGLKCLEHVLGIQFNYLDIRKKFNIERSKQIDIETLTKIYDKYEDKKSLKIIELNYNGKFDPKNNDYLILHKSHYYIVIKVTQNELKDLKTKRGLLFWDLESRKTEKMIKIRHTDIETGKLKKIKSPILKDTILAVWHRPYKAKTYQKRVFITNDRRSSVRQFIDFLTLEASRNQHYNCIAHNGARFDHYFLLSEMSPVEQYQTDYQLRGYSVIGLQYCSHLFKDSYCFLTESLHSLCESFKIDPKYWKQDTFEYKGKTMTNLELCFYKPELTFKQFMALEKEEPQFWKLYTDYCSYDCISLSKIWESFDEEVVKIITKIDPRLLRFCGLHSCNTIGSLVMKIVRTLHGFKENKEVMNEVVEFIDDRDKFNFINGITREVSMKYGGISHCHKPGYHTEQISNVDIASQYPTAIYHMKVPCGKSRWTAKWQPDSYGFYQLKNLVFDCKYKLKPICERVLGKSLNWSTGDTVELACLDTWMIKYLKKYYGLKSFQVIKGLVSDQFMEGKVLFGKVILTLYGEKAEQDRFKSSKSKDYNQALRSTIKLLLNALSGKFNEDIHKYFTVTTTEDETGMCIGAVNIEKKYEDQYNRYITCGVMLYSYSKRLLFEYIRMLPNNSDSVIHIETDSIYFRTDEKKQFFDNIKKYDGDYPVAVGNDLGNVKLEKDGKVGTYFLGKKFYYIDMNCMRIKGIPQSTINDYGIKETLVDITLYIDIFHGLSVRRTFKTMIKQLFKANILISSYEMTRTIKPNCKYYIYK